MIDKVYIEAVIETLDFLHQMINHLHSTHQIHSINAFLSQIQTIANSKINSSSEQRFNIVMPADEEKKPIKYWEGVRDMAKLSQKKWFELNDISKYLVFLRGTRSTLAGKIGLKDTTVNPVEDFGGEAPVHPDIEPTPRPIPVIKTPDKLSALDEALQASGIETSPPPESSSSLSDRLLAKDCGGEKSAEEDDMLSLSLRDKDSATPFVYYFPYPKRPPAASAEGHFKIMEFCPQCGERNILRKTKCSFCNTSLPPSN